MGLHEMETPSSLTLKRGRSTLTICPPMIPIPGSVTVTLRDTMGQSVTYLLEGEQLENAIGVLCGYLDDRSSEEEYEEVLDEVAKDIGYSPKPIRSHRGPRKRQLVPGKLKAGPSHTQPLE